MKKTWLLIAGLLAAMAVGSVLRAYPIASRLLWYDEAADWLSSAKSAGVHYSQFFFWTHDFEAAPLMFFIRRVFMDLMGSEAEWVQRLPAVVLSIGCIPLAFWLGKDIGRGSTRDSNPGLTE